jgi:Mg2+-importing ATPase
MPSQWSTNQQELFIQLKSSTKGLSSQEAKSRLKQYGLNAIPDKDKREWLDILISQFASPLLIILIFASIIAAILGDVFDTIIILVIVLFSALLGFFQEYKSEKVLSELKKYFSYNTVAIRDGEKTHLDIRDLVPGDIVNVGIGDIIPADLRIIESDGLLLNESVLTGESRGVQKNSKQCSESATNPQDISNGLFMGTTVLEGHAVALVVSTGKNTLFGKTTVIFSSKVPESDFQIGVRKFGNALIKVIIILSSVIFISNYLLGHGGQDPLVESALFALAIAIGIAPEALPAVISITLSNGSMMLAKKKVVTKKLAAIEDLGNMDILCTDKTGTLTDEMKVDRYVDLDKRDSHDVMEYAALCNSAVGTFKIRGNAVDVAIKRHAIQLGLDLSRFEKLAEIPFDFKRRRMGQIVNEGKKSYLIVKGAPEHVFEVCLKAKITGKEYPLKTKAKELKKMIADYNLEGISTIAVAYKELKSDNKQYTISDEKNLIFIGFILLKNRPKPSVLSTIDRLKKLGVGLKVLTGDDPLVTNKLCSHIGLAVEGGKIILGKEVAEATENSIRELVERANVFARVTPDQKLRIIEALRANGHVVGFLGDGINDAPSLRTADVGISVNTAADVAKGASHIILLQKSLGVICDGVENGRKIFGNITKYLLNTMSANQGNMITVALSSFFLPFLPLLPSQILLNNLVSDLPLMTIATDNVDKSYTKKPQKWNINFILKFMVFFGVISTIFDLLFICILQFVMHVDMETFRTAWFLESVLSEMLIVFSLRTRLPFFRNMPSIILAAASAGAIALSFAIVYFAPLAGLFYFVPLGGDMLLLTAATLAAYFATTELGKVYFFSRIVPENNAK